MLIIIKKLITKMDNDFNINYSYEHVCKYNNMRELRLKNLTTKMHTSIL